jgi:hypothetical protein
MSRRAIPALLLVLIGLIAMVVVGRDTPEQETPFFAATGGTWMPAVGVSGSLTGSWFCPGLPTAGEGAGGAVVVSNSDAAQIVGRYMVLTEDGVAADESFTVDSWSQTTIDVDAFTSAPFASVVVEIEGGGGLVEQRAQHPLGDSVAACSNDTSATWYVADGYTLEDSVETLILTNPFDEPVVASLRFSTEAREAQPGQFGGFTVPPRSVRTIQIAELGARDEPIISVAVEATAGRLVVGRAQEYNGGGRFGFDVSLAAPELRDQWWFADGERTEGVTETYSIYNPTEDEVEVQVFFGGIPLASSAVNEQDPVVVPPRRAVIFDPMQDRGNTFEEGGDGAEGGNGEGDTSVEPGEDDEQFVELQPPSSELPEGRHSTVFSTLAQPSIVVERVLTRPSEGSIATSVVMGATNGPNAFVANTWHMGIGPSEPTEQALVIYNIDQVEAAITVSVIGPGGPSAVPSLTDVPLPSGSILTVDLVDPDVIGREVVVVSSSRVFIERLLPRGNDLPGRSGSWLLPQSG